MVKKSTILTGPVRPLFLIPGPIFIWVRIILLFKNLGKIAQILVPDLTGDIRDLPVGILQKLLCDFQSVVSQIFIKRNPHFIFKQSAKIDVYKRQATAWQRPDFCRSL